MPSAICHHRGPEILLSPLLWFFSLLPQQQTTVAILKVTNSSLLHLELGSLSRNVFPPKPACCMPLFHNWDLCWMQMLYDWHCVSCVLGGQQLWRVTLNGSVWVHMTCWTPARYPGKAEQWKETARACMKQHNTSLFLPLFIEYDQWRFTRRYLPLSVTSLFFVATSSSSLLSLLLMNEKKADCFSIEIAFACFFFLPFPHSDKIWYAVEA